MGDYEEAILTQHKAVMMSERVLGIDHPQTATEYVSHSTVASSVEHRAWHLDSFGSLFVCQWSGDQCVEITLPSSLHYTGVLR